MPLVVHYWADLQSVHGLHRYSNTRNAQQSPAVIRQVHRTPHTLRMPAKTPLTSDNIDAPAACAIPFRPYSGVLYRERELLASTCLYTRSMPSLFSSRFTVPSGL